MLYPDGCLSILRRHLTLVLTIETSVGETLGAERVPELKVALLNRALPSLVLTAEVWGWGWGWGIPQVELVKLPELQPFKTLSFQAVARR